MSTDAKDSERPELSKYAYASSLYFVFVGVLYLWGYWGSFGINVLEFAGISDIIKTTAYPIATTFGFFAVGAVFGEVLVDRSPGHEATLEGKFWSRVRRHIELIAMLYIAGVVALFIFGPESKWRVLPVLLALPIYAAVKRLGFLETAIPNEQTRSIFIFLLVSLPLFSYGQGKTKALAITEARSYTYLTSSIDGVAANSSTAKESRLRYLGQVNDYLFFYNPEGKTNAVVRFEHAKAIQLAMYEAQEAAKPSGSTPATPKTAVSSASAASTATRAASQASGAAP